MSDANAPPEEPAPRGESRIRARNRAAILEAALTAFSQRGFRGTTIDEIARRAGLSKPNLLYYFPSKAAIHRALLDGLLDTWLAPLRALDPAGDPLAELQTYIARKLEMSRSMPRESRLFANEVLNGAPMIRQTLRDDLKALVDDKAQVIARWIEEGRLAPVDPHHLIFSIWAVTQHYADFDVQVRSVLGARADRRFEDAQATLETLFLRGLAPRGREGGG